MSENRMWFNEMASIPYWCVLASGLNVSERMALISLWAYAMKHDDGRFTVVDPWRLLDRCMGVPHSVASGLIAKLIKEGLLGHVHWRVWELSTDLLVGDRKAPIPGHIYVIEFSDGRIKVGRSSSPDARVRNHMSDARRSQMYVRRSWVSTWIAAPAMAEHQLINSREFACNVIPGTREYAQGADFDTIVGVAAEIVDEQFCGGES